MEPQLIRPEPASVPVREPAFDYASNPVMEEFVWEPLRKMGAVESGRPKMMALLRHPEVNAAIEEALEDPELAKKLEGDLLESIWAAINDLERQRADPKIQERLAALRAQENLYPKNIPELIARTGPHQAEDAAYDLRDYLMQRLETLGGLLEVVDLFRGTGKSVAQFEAPLGKELQKFARLCAALRLYAESAEGAMAAAK